MNQIIIFTDGSSRGNPGPGGWGAVTVFPNGRIQENGGRDKKTTNNRMELSAVIASLQAISGQKKPVTIYSDSRYVINGITKWVEGWRQNGWRSQSKEPILNQDLWKVLVDVSEEYAKDSPIEWHYMPGHSGVPGNERADEIATAFADNKDIDLYDGPIEDYQIDVMQLDVNKEKKQAKKRRTGKAYSYISLVDGEFAKHHDWASCEAKVKGKAGAKYRKTLSKEDEDTIKKDWGIV